MCIPPHTLTHSPTRTHIHTHAQAWLSVVHAKLREQQLAERFEITSNLLLLYEVRSVCNAFAEVRSVCNAFAEVRSVCSAFAEVRSVCNAAFAFPLSIMRGKWHSCWAAIRTVCALHAGWL